MWVGKESKLCSSFADCLLTIVFFCRQVLFYFLHDYPPHMPLSVTTKVWEYFFHILFLPWWRTRTSNSWPSVLPANFPPLLFQVPSLITFLRLSSASLPFPLLLFSRTSSFKEITFNFPLILVSSRKFDLFYSHLHFHSLFLLSASLFWLVWDILSARYVIRSVLCFFSGCVCFC